MKHLLYILLVMPLLLASCIEDGISTSPSDQPTFSVDTLDMGEIFTTDASPTHSFVVYNRHDKVMNISQISMRDGNCFRINVDGVAGKSFSNVEIRPNDSIFVFVEATVPLAGSGAPVVAEDEITFLTNGVSRSVLLRVTGHDVERLRSRVITRDTTLTDNMPHQIFDSLVVSPGVTLTLAEGTRLHFHDKARLVVRGTLRSMGTAEKPVEMQGDRIDNVVGSISFDLMASQWDGVEFLTGSRDNYLQWTCIRNTVYGVVADSLGVDTTPNLTLLNCRLRNAAGHALEVIHSSVTAVGCEIADAGAGAMYLQGGNHRFDHCTFANYYLFTAIGGPNIALSHVNADDSDGSTMPLMQALFSNCISYSGIGRSDLSHGELEGTGVVFNTCALRANGSDDANFINCMWDCDPLFYTVRNEYIFDYRVQEESPVISGANTSMADPRGAVDWYNVPRAGTLGAYQYTPRDDEDTRR